MAGANVQPIYRDVKPFAYQQPPPTQTQFLQPQPGVLQPHSNQPMIPQRLPQAGDQLSFDGSFIRAPMSSQSGLPGYLDLGVGEPNPVRFNTAAPEIVGRPIETVIRNRRGPRQPGVGRAAFTGFEQNKDRPFLGAK